MAENENKVEKGNSTTNTCIHFQSPAGPNAKLVEFADQPLSWELRKLFEKIENYVIFLHFIGL